MARLNQLVCIEKDVKSTASKAMNNFYHAIQRTNALAGLVRTYRKVDEDGEDFPDEKTLVQIDVESYLHDLTKTQIRVMDVTLSKDTTNCTAKADVVVDGITILSNVPLTYLLFLEKRLVDWHAVVLKLPVLDPAQNWTRSENANAWVADPVQTTKTKKIPKILTLFAPTKEHPGQAKEYGEDVVTGYWTKQEFSGALPAVRIAELLERIEKLRSAVKFAREEANMTEVIDAKAGQAFFDFILS